MSNTAKLTIVIDNTDGEPIHQDDFEEAILVNVDYILHYLTEVLGVELGSTSEIITTPTKD